MSSEPTPIRIAVPEQGFDQTYQSTEIKRFFDGEHSFFNSLQPVLREQMTWENRGFQINDTYGVTMNNLREIQKELEKDNTKPLDAYISDAGELKVVIGQGEIGKRIIELVGKGNKRDAKWVFHMFSQRWSGPALEEFLAPIRAAVFGNPTFTSFRDIVTSNRALQLAEAARAQSQKTATGFEKFYAEKSKLITDLEELFRKKIPVEESAAYWLASANTRTAEWRLWLSVFAVLALAPVVVGLLCWESVAGAVTRVTVTGGAISLGGVAAISVPAILYLWVLKNISRIFQQRLMLADDAGHRRVLTMTILVSRRSPDWP